MRSCVNTIAVLVVFSCFIIPIRAETIYEDEFNGDGPLSEKDWLTNAGYTQVSGEAKPASPGNLVLVPPLPMDPNTVYIVSFKGCKLSTDKANVGDNWFGLMDVSNGWTPHRGIALRLTGDNEISIAIDLEGPGQFQSGTPMKLLAGQVYDFQFKFQPGGIVQIFGNQAGAEPNLLVQRRKAPTSPLSVSTYMDQSMLSISAVKIEKEEPMELKESAMELLAVLPKSFQAVIATKATFHMDKFPIGFWNYVELEGYPDKIDEAEVRGWADCGASVMIGPETQEWAADHPTKVKQILQWCQQFGIKLIVSDRRAKVKIDPATQLPPADYKEQIKKVYDDYGGYPAFWGLVVHDEPAQNVIPATVASVRAHREVAPQYHPFMNWWAFWPEWNMHGSFATPTDWLVDYVDRSKSDFILYDNYTQCWPGPHGTHPKYGDTGWDKHFLNLIHYRLASLRCGIPFWVTLACVDHMNYEVDLVNLRWQFNTSVASGAGGVMWFFYYMRDFEANYRSAPIDERWERTSTWYDLRRVHLDFRQKYGDLFNRLVSTRMTFVGRTYGGGLPFTPNGVIAAVKPYTHETVEPINVQVGEFADLEGDRYVMLVNLDRQKSVCLRVTFPGKDTRVHTFKQGRPWKTWNWDMESKAEEQGVSFQVWLGPGQETVLGVDSIQARATPVKLETPPSDRCVDCVKHIQDQK